MISIANAEHYVWGGCCDGWHLVRDGGLSVIQERMPPGTEEVRHFHRRAQQFFYVLSGSLVIDHGGERETLVAGSGLSIAPGVAHQVRNESGADAAFLVVSAPPAHGDREPVYAHLPCGSRPGTSDG